ncbi:FxLYD domain-containing protein [Natronorarus salvus]|uniref:FxLYD domain-containing protein n=1 Tax=Natronorarus salvus TaxID=3117733 RepID=UPI002F260BE0
MHRRRLLAAGSATLLTAVTGCLGNFGPTDGPAEPDPEERVRIVESELVREGQGTDEETVAVEGVAQIIGDEEIRYVEVRAEFYDAEDDLLDTTVERIEDVTERRRWEFRIEYPHYGDEAAEVRGYSVDVATSL